MFWKGCVMMHSYEREHGGCKRCWNIQPRASLNVSGLWAAAMHSDLSWSSQELFFLSDALRCCGMSVAEIADFFGREVTEVSDKAKALGIKVRHSRSCARAKGGSPRAALTKPRRVSDQRGTNVLGPMAV